MPARRRYLPTIVLATLALLASAGVIAFEALRTPGDIAARMRSNVREEIVALKGGQAMAANEAGTVHDEALAFGFVNGRILPDATATWVLNTDTLSRLSAASHTFRAQLFFQAFGMHGNVPNAYVTVAVNGLWRERFNLNRVVRVRVGRGYVTEYRPLSTDNALVPLITDYAIQAHVLALRATDIVGHRQVVVRVTEHGAASWNINLVGIRLTYEPSLAHFFVRNSAAVLIVALAEILGIIAWGLFVLRAIRAMLTAVACVVLCLTVLTQDPWDTPVWQYLCDIVEFGGGLPAHAWAGTPLWSFLPGILSPIGAAFYTLTGSSPPILTAGLLKIVLTLCYLTTIVLVGRLAPRSRRREFTLLFFLSAFSLCLVSWGVRDLIAALFIAASIVVLRERSAFLVSAALVGLGSSIDEYFAPLTLLPAAAYLLRQTPRLPSAWLGAAALALATPAFILIQWASLPRQYAQSITAFRLDFRYADWTWQFLLSKVTALPALLTHNELAVSAAIYASVVGFFLVRLALVVRSAGPLPPREAVALILPAITGCVAAFYVSYGQVDPQEYFGLILLLVVVAMVRNVSTFPILIFNSVAAMELYTHIGVRKFLGPTFFNPSEVAFTGTRNQFDLVLIAVLIFAVFWFIAWLGGDARTSPSWSRTPASLWLLAVSLLGIARGSLPTDGVAVAAFATLSVAVWGRLRLRPGFVLRTPDVAAALALIAANVGLPPNVSIAIASAGILYLVVRNWVDYSSFDYVLVAAALGLVIVRNALPGGDSIVNIVANQGLAAVFVAWSVSLSENFSYRRLRGRWLEQNSRARLATSSGEAPTN